MLIYVDGEFFNFVIGAGILIDLHLQVRIVYQHVLIEEKKAEEVIEINLPRNFCGLSVLTATYINNRLKKRN